MRRFWLNPIIAIVAFAMTISVLGADTVANKDRTVLSDGKYRELFGALPPHGKESDPEFMEILRKFIFGEVFYTGDLDDRTRELLTITALSASQALPQLKGHINAALNIGVKPLEVREAIYGFAPSMGFPKTLNAISVMNEVFAQRKITLPPSKNIVKESERYEKGRALRYPLYGDKTNKSLEGLPEELKTEVSKLVIEFNFGDFYTRDGLSTAKRELLRVALLATDGSEKEQIKTHAIGALKAGNDKDTILAAMVHLIPYIGLPKALKAIEAVKDLDESDAAQNADAIFPKGARGPAEWFSGTVWVSTLANPNDMEGLYSVGSVTFEAGARTYWHTHPLGQVLLVIDGEGWYQERGKPARFLVKGDVVTIPKNTEHWHGAVNKSSFTHIAITNLKDGSNVTWLKPVTDKEYSETNR
ncbi:MAG: carboxymuconolactone decarboxylase family protein [Campylobacteraceae bacterium]|jgi:4-carboxymuconolactone decarboxylase|nr:carboxymuconolactone decarboxylase family protein [Campylobacteraceae bacterium]